MILLSMPFGIIFLDQILMNELLNGTFIEYSYKYELQIKYTSFKKQSIITKIRKQEFQVKKFMPKVLDYPEYSKLDRHKNPYDF